MRSHRLGRHLILARRAARRIGEIAREIAIDEIKEVGWLRAARERRRHLSEIAPRSGRDRAEIARSEILARREVSCRGCAVDLRHLLRRHLPLATPPSTMILLLLRRAVLPLPTRRDAADHVGEALLAELAQPVE